MSASTCARVRIAAPRPVESDAALVPRRFITLSGLASTQTGSSPALALTSSPAAAFQSGIGCKMHGVGCRV